MEPSNIIAFYNKYIDCLNSRKLSDLHLFVNKSLTYNHKPIQLEDYQDMLSQNFRDIPDLHFRIGLVMADEDKIACRLNFSCTPAGEFKGIAINGKKVDFFRTRFLSAV